MQGEPDAGRVPWNLPWVKMVLYPLMSTQSLRLGRCLEIGTLQMELWWGSQDDLSWTRMGPKSHERVLVREAERHTASETQVEAV